MKYSIKNEKIVFDGFLKIKEAEVTYDTFSGGSLTAKRLAMDRGDSVAILLVEKETQSIILTKQFRYPTTKHDKGWILEIPAGTLEEDECPLNAIKREVLEETGYYVSQPEQIHNFYTSPGGTTERVFLFFAEVSQRDQIEKDGGKENENEDIKIVKIPLKEIDDYIFSEKIDNAFTLIAFQWLKIKIMSGE